MEYKTKLDKLLAQIYLFNMALKILKEGKPFPKDWWNSKINTILGREYNTTLKPKIAEQWHPTKNGDFTPNDITPGSKKIVWWKCDKADDHEWTASILNRSRGSGCPWCTLTPQSKQELIITSKGI